MGLGGGPTLLEIDPANDAAEQYLRIYHNKMPQQSSSVDVAPESTPKGKPLNDVQWAAQEKMLEEGYNALILEAKLLHFEISSAASEHGGISTDEREDMLSKLKAISEGHVGVAIQAAQ